MNSKRKIRIALLCVSALVLAAWGVLMVIFFGGSKDNDKKKNNESDGTYYRYDESGNLIREWDASDEEEYTSYQYEAVRLTAKQLAESRKFYTDDPGKMKRITVYRT